MGEERIRIESYNMNEGKQTIHAHTYSSQISIPFLQQTITILCRHEDACN
jgi:hypothetical protein